MIKLISLGIILLLLLGLSIVPIKSIWIEDEELYGNYWCNHETGKCILTKGHSTQIKVSLLEYYLKEGKS